MAQNCHVVPGKVMKQLQKARIEDDSDKKLSILNKLISKNPNESAVYFALAETYMQEGNISLKTQNSPSEGEQLLKKAAYYYQISIQKCASYNHKSYYNLGNIFFSMRKDKEALFCYKSLVEFEQKYPQRTNGNYKREKTNALKIIEGLEFEDKMRANPVPFSPAIVNRVSTELDEYFPMISPDNDLLFYSRKVDRARLGDIANNVVEEFTISYKEGSSNTFTAGKALDDPFNDGTFNNYGSATLSVDNREMIICACKKERIYRQNYLNCDLYVTKFKRTGEGGNDFQWSPLVNLGENINTKDGWEAQPSLSSDGQTLFFTSIRKGSRDNDIYISEKQADGTWGKARPFEEINTAGKDKSPFFHQDGETLYFVSSTSQERRGMGGLDIFYIRRDGDSWTKPQNIGYPINSPEDELGIFVSTSGRIAYFSSFKDGDWNIYAFNLYKEARPEEVIIVKGSLANNEGEFVADANISIHYDDTGQKQEVKVNRDDGSYAAAVKVNDAKSISIVAEKENATFAISQINLRPLQTIQYEKPILPKLDAKDSLIEQTKINEDSAIENAKTDTVDLQTNASDLDLEAEETSVEMQKDTMVFEQLEIQRIPYSSLNESELQAIKPLNDSKPLQLEVIIIDSVTSGSKFELNDLLFKTDSYTLFEESKAILDLFAIYLTSNPEYFIKIEGHTDDIGDDRSNLLLSQKRAQEVRKYLISKSIDKDRLQAKGYGEQKPKVANISDENRRINRRTECQIIIR
ncbi:MAG: OmpA family protein [Crocinitomicaceae bacterium]